MEKSDSLLSKAAPSEKVPLTCRNRATRAGAVSGALTGFACGIISWLAYAQVGPSQMPS